MVAEAAPAPARTPFALTGSRALVTAASRGLGREIALELAGQGADVVLGVRDPDGSAGLLEELRAFGVDAAAIRMDVLDLAACRAAIDAVTEQRGPIDILVNNAGGGIDAPALEVTEEDFDHVWQLNTRSTFFLSQHVAKSMRENGGGAIVNVASQAGLVALPGEASYCAAKAAVVHLTRCLAVEWGQYGIRVNAVAPTFIETDGTSAALSDDAFRADTVERIAALHRIGEPREVSGAVAFLASPSASLITGQTLAIDGGWTAR
ncbi:SDR family NAD(P)-dependent oxidoreductase [Leifsonia sp. 21MFCrub1.1]|uniref:SDR family NAD(P)-dependent oxidoreductase n=1 Tax=Leifsonia sp. 21MFCrub1.1 TaxID=1798223 RepID=UPI00089298EE|nr:3-oxoacyl-ACP reductase family protein [Leifsonia sp. 21MFCrub1.1]SEA58379.1 NAD(P)-dependent dehydrogenase, short-chain alcohol dehydrogenase family [Leifsonia sp. 21MFCrub1.1]